jgi:deoxyribose-phosphate aldolase
MSNILNTLQLFCGKSAAEAPRFAEIEKAGYEIETAPAFSNKHVFHFTGRCNRSVGSIVTSGANPYDIFALLAESEIGNPFLVWEPEKVRDTFMKREALRKKQTSGAALDSNDTQAMAALASEISAQRKPIILYGPDSEWKGFMDALDHLSASGTLREGFKDSITRCRTPEEVLGVLSQRVPKDLSGKSTADYRYHTYEPGAKPVTEYVAMDDPRVRPRTSISFFGSASSKRPQHLRTAARSVEMCHSNGWGIVNGGGVNSVMGKQLEIAKELGVYTHGISAHERGAVGLTGSEKDPEKIKQLMPRYTDCKDMIHRIEHYLEHSQGIACLDGGIGSGEEIFMVLEMFRQQHKATKYQDTSGKWHDKPFVIIDENNTWSPVINEWAKKQYGESYLAPVKYVHSMQEAEELFARQFEQSKPVLPGEVVERIVNSAQKELQQKISDLKPAPQAATAGRAKTVHDWQETMSLVDLTNLKPEATAEDITKLAKTARLQHARSVCVRPNFVHAARTALGKNSDVKVITVTNFPDGKLPVEKAVKEMQDARSKGADEIDTLFPKDLLAAGKWEESHRYLKRVIGSVDVPVKVILETAELTPEQIARASIVARSAGAQFVKTSTGFSAKGGADVEAVEIMRRSVGDSVGVKASGGVKTFEQAMAMIEAGADVLGCSGLSITSQQERVPAIRVTDQQEHLPGYAMRGMDTKTGTGRGY